MSSSATSKASSFRAATSKTIVSKPAGHKTPSAQKADATSSKKRRSEEKTSAAEVRKAKKGKTVETAPPAEEPQAVEKPQIVEESQTAEAAEAAEAAEESSEMEESPEPEGPQAQSAQKPKKIKQDTEGTREAKRLFQLKYATRKLDRTRYKGYTQSMNDAIHPIAFKTMDDDTMFAVRTSYLESLRSKMVKTIKSVNKKEDPAICKTFSMKNLWRYCYCFSSVFFGRGVIYRYDNTDIPAIDSFDGLDAFLRENSQMELELFTNKPKKTVVEFAKVVDGSVPLKRMLEPLLIQSNLFLRTFVRPSTQDAAQEAEAAEEAEGEGEDLYEEAQEGQQEQEQVNDDAKDDEVVECERIGS